MDRSQVWRTSRHGYCGASTTGLFDNKKQTWIDEVCEHFGVPESLLPAVEPSDKVIGVVSERASAETGIPADASIVRGTGDNPAAAICTGCLLEAFPPFRLAQAVC
ncbi:MAG: FGGY family carbohydrate kinase [Collinsella sp.]